MGAVGDMNDVCTLYWCLEFVLVRFYCSCFGGGPS